MNNSKTTKKQLAYIDQVLIITFLIFLLVVPIFWLVRKTEINRSLIEGRELSQFSVLFPTSSYIDKDAPPADPEPLQYRISQFFSVNTLESIQNASSDQFPFRDKFIFLAKDYDRAMIRAAYAFVPGSFYQADMQSNIFYYPEDDVLFQRPLLYTNYSRKMIDGYIENYNILIEEHPDVQFMVFYFQLIQNSKFHPLNDLFYQADQGQNYDYFMENKPEELLVSNMPFTSYEDELKWFYRTDHHWNIQGFMNAYDIIYEMLKEVDPTLSPKRTVGEPVGYTDLVYFGSYARQTLIPIRPDVFEFFDYQLPDYQLTDGNGEKTNYQQQQKYWNKTYSTVPYVNHYSNYFGTNIYLLQFDFEEGSDKKLLIVGSSFDNPLLPLIASHYKTTYCVDLRKTQYFSFEEFIEQHPVDQVLVIGSNNEVFTGANWHIYP